MNLPKLKWKISEAPTGRYRSFEHRPWPMALYPDGQLAAQIVCEDSWHRSYKPRVAKSGEHPPLTLHVFDYSDGVQVRHCRKAKTRPKTVAEAKELLVKTLTNHSHFIPTEFRQTQGDAK